MLVISTRNFNVIMHFDFTKQKGISMHGYLMYIMGSKTEISK